MKNRKNLKKMSRVKVAGAACLGAAIAFSLLVSKVTPAMTTVAAIAFGLCLGILSWALYFNAQPEQVKDSIYPFLPSPAVAKGVVCVTVVSAFVVSFAEAPVVKLMGAAAFAATIGLLIAQALFNDE